MCEPDSENELANFTMGAMLQEARLRDENPITVCADLCRGYGTVFNTTQGKCNFWYYHLEARQTVRIDCLFHDRGEVGFADSCMY